MREAAGVTRIGVENDLHSQTVSPKGVFVNSAISTDSAGAERCPVMEYTERLRRLAINDSGLTDVSFDGAVEEPLELDPKSLALVRLGAFGRSRWGCCVLWSACRRR